MTTTARDHGNKVLDGLPEFSGEIFVYREAPWIDFMLRGAMAVFAVAILYLAIVTAFKVGMGFTLLALISAVTLFYVVAVMRSPDRAIHFICTRDGLYFPESSLFKRVAPSWLFVPWRNVQDYGVQLLLDETSSRGLVLSLRVAREEEHTYFAGHKVFRITAPLQFESIRSILIGYSSLVPRPRDVLVELRKFDSVSRHEDAPESDGLESLKITSQVLHPG